jgi:hypothetical protein
VSEELITGLIYAISSAILLALILSYWLMWRLEHKRHILALLLFFISTLVSTIIGNVHIWSQLITGETYDIPYIWVRGLLTIAATSFLLHTTWNKNLKGGIGNIKEISRREEDKGTSREKPIDKSS